MNTARLRGTREKIALAGSGAILIASVIYWIKQLSDAIEMLQLAHGG